MSAPPLLFDRDRIARRLARRRAGVKDFVAQLVLEDLADRLATVTRRFEKALVVAPLAALLPTRLATRDGPVAFTGATTLLPAPGLPLLDAEKLFLPENDYELIISILDLQVVNDVPGYLLRMRQQLRPDGLFLAALLGGDTLSELRRAFLAADAEISGGAFARVAPFVAVREAGALLQRAGFALPVVDVETHIVRYGQPFALMEELRMLGASNPLAGPPQRMASRTLLATAAGAYADDASDPDGRVRATLEIIWMSGWAPADSQQKPLRPGSAKVDLRDVLGKKA